MLEANPDANVGMFAISMKDGVDVVTENMSSPGFVVYKDSENMDTVKKYLIFGLHRNMQIFISRIVQDFQHLRMLMVVRFQNT